MDMKEVLKWGVIAVVAVFALRWVSGAFRASISGTVNQIGPYDTYPVAQWAQVLGTAPTVFPGGGWTQRGKGRRGYGNQRAQY